MTTDTWVFVLVAAVVLGIILFAVPFKEHRGGPAIVSALEEQASVEGRVKVSVRPKGIAPSILPWEFQVILDTHSYELSEDIAQVAGLLTDRGDRYTPRAWKGDLPGGHHREGVLQFDPIAPYPKSITLIVREVGGIPERAFTWDLK